MTPTDIYSLVKERHNVSSYKELNWTGSFQDYLRVLTGIDPLRVCVAYEIDGERTKEFPESTDALARAKPVYEELPGWSAPLRGVRSPEELPATTRAYLDRLVELSNCTIVLVSVGPGREETVSGFAGMALSRGRR